MASPLFIQKPGVEPGSTMHAVAAPLRRRTIAWGVDVFIVSCPAVIVSMLLIAVTGGDPLNEEAGIFGTISADSDTAAFLSGGTFALMLGLTWLAYAGLLTAREGPRNGQTLGKQLLGIRIVAADAAPLAAPVAWRRAIWVAALFTLSDVIGMLADLALGTAPHGTNAGDIISTLVVAATVATAFVSPIGRSFYDQRVGTAVISDLRPGEIANEPPSGAPGAITPRARDAVSWLLLALAAIAVVYFLADVLWPGFLG